MNPAQKVMFPLVLWTLLTTGGFAADVDRSKDLIRSGKFVEARDVLLEKALTGDLDSQTALLNLVTDQRNLADCFCRKDVQESYRNNANLPDGLSNLGFIHENGLGVPRDYDKGRQLFEQAMREGSLLAVNNLGYMLERGLGVPRDYAKARELYELAVRRGNFAGADSLGFIHGDGLGVPQDYARAREFYEQAAKGGYSKGAMNLAYLYEEGLGGPKSLDRAWALYLEGAYGGLISTVKHLENFTLRCHTDPGRAAYWLTRAKNSGLGLTFIDEFGVRESPQIFVGGRLDVGSGKGQIRFGTATSILDRSLTQAQSLWNRETLDPCSICREGLIFKTSLVAPACHLLRAGPIHFFCPECLQNAGNSGQKSCPICRQGDLDKNLVGVYFKDYSGKSEAGFLRALELQNFTLAAEIQGEVFRALGNLEAIDLAEANAVQSIETEQVAIDAKLEALLISPQLEAEAEAFRAKALKADHALTTVRSHAAEARLRLTLSEENI